jgi:hypothetical protein
MLARPATIAAMPVRDRLASRSVYAMRALRTVAAARPCEQRGSLRTGKGATIISGFSRERARRCTLIDQRFTEDLCEARRDRAQAFAPMRQRECELMRQRRGDPANAIRQLAEVASGELAIFQEIEQEGIHVRAHRLGPQSRSRAERQRAGRLHYCC